MKPSRVDDPWTDLNRNPPTHLAPGAAPSGCRRTSALDGATDDDGPRALLVHTPVLESGPSGNRSDHHHRDAAATGDRRPNKMQLWVVQHSLK